MQVIEGNPLVGGINLNLPDTIVVRILPNDPSDAEKYFFSCSASDSTGVLQFMNPEWDSGGVNVSMFWQTGRQSPRQDIKCYLLSNCAATKGCELLDSVTISAAIKQPWTNVFSGSGTLTDIRFISDHTALAVGDFGSGIVRSDDGGTTWTATPAFRSDLRKLCFRDSLNGFVTVANDYAYATTDGGKSFVDTGWTPPIIGDGTAQDFSMVSANTIYSVGVQGTIVKSVDAGKTWQKYTGFTFINEFFAISCPDSNNCFACGEAGKVVKTSDGGQGWQSVDPLVNNHLYAICFLNKDVGFAGGQAGTLIRTTDGGATWSLVRTGLRVTIFSIRFFDMLHGVVVSATGEIADTKDGGVTWQKECPGNYGVFSLQKAAIKDTRTVFAVQNGSIFKYDIAP
ncbi:MAG TPA: YCF48-related protein [Puia sp.]|nr:YCF48-related protein [Puia sp.]